MTQPNMKKIERHLKLETATTTSYTDGSEGRKSLSILLNFVLCKHSEIISV